MQFALIHYNAPGATLEAFLDYAAGCGFDAVELQCADVWDETDERADPEARAVEVRALAEARGVAICAFAASNDFLTLDPHERNVQVARMERICNLGKLLGTNVIRTEGGWQTDKVPEDKWADALAACLRRCVPFLEEMDVYLALDNHGKVTNDAQLQLLVLGMTGSKYVGTTLDTMNYRWMGWSIERCNRFYELSSLRALHLHLKDGNGSLGNYKGAVLGDGEVDLVYAIKCLKRAGYGGVWCIEYEGRDADGYTRCLEWAKKNVPKIMA
jgi:sugar phosphate isomerase/epimerase